MSETSIDSRNLFVVHGRNEAGRKALFEFLRSINLNPLEWAQIVKATGKMSPYIGEILAQGFAMARAAVVLMTPDDEARLKKEFWLASDGESEKEFTGQPRQNVLFEAGMALGLQKDRTVIVELGRLRSMSDTLGRHVVRMDGSIAMRQNLAQRLRAAGCDVNTDGTDWHSAGDFQASIAANVGPETSPTEPDKANEPTTSPPVRDEADRPKTPTAADFVNLGEHLWYLSNPGLVGVDDFIKTIRGFLRRLDDLSLGATRAAASSLENLQLTYDVRNNLLSWQSQQYMRTIMIPIRSVLEREANTAK